MGRNTKDGKGKGLMKGLAGSRKAFIGSALVDIWSYILFAIIILVFALIFKYGAESKLQALTDNTNIIYGNYMAQVYLRIPVKVGGENLTMAELIAIYDYNQSSDPDPEDCEDTPGWSLNGDIEFCGKKNAMSNAIIDITDDFVKTNFPKECFIFEIYGNSFYYVNYNKHCSLSLAWDKGFSFSHDSMAAAFGDDVPDHLFKTHAPQVDPRQETILVVSVYDIETMLRTFGK
jgi:hypothetical protein